MTRISVSINCYITLPQEHGDSTWGAPGSPEKASVQGYGSVGEWTGRRGDRWKRKLSHNLGNLCEPKAAFLGKAVGCGGHNSQVEFRGLSTNQLPSMAKCLMSVGGSLAALGTASASHVDLVGAYVHMGRSIEAVTCCPRSRRRI